jgi:hypothetical protein
MKRSAASLTGLAVLGCARAFMAAPPPVVDDPSIVFPQFFEQEPVQVGAQGQPFLMEGVVLRALTVAADDFLPPEGVDQPCARRRASHVFRVITREDVVFIRIDEDPVACGEARSTRLDSGVRYAISRDGRILRRVLDGMELYVPSSDAGALEQAEPGASPTFDAASVGPLPFLTDVPDAGRTPPP